MLGLLRGSLRDHDDYDHDHDLWDQCVAEQEGIIRFSKETERKQPNRKFILESHYAWFAISPGKYRKFFLIDDLLVITFDLRLEHYAQDHYD